MGVWKIVKCPRCGNMQLTQAERAAGCFRCGFSIRITDKTTLFTAGSQVEAREYLIKAKMREAK